ncbi:MAG: LLM class F420-dependent oxidoreductase [Solirubrobacterales bacterium]
MKLGLNLGYFGIGPQGDDALQLTRVAEDAGFDSVWVAESYGSDVVSVLAWLAGQTETIKLGAAIMQVPARPPAAAAMAGATIDYLSDGRFIFGFGPSGPQVSEGWYGVPYPKPYSRTREYIEVVRTIIARTAPLDHDGEFFTLPLPEGEGWGQGKPLKLNFHPVRNEIPVFIAANGPKSVSMALEVGDGWIPIFVTAEKFNDVFGESIDKGLEAGGKQRSDVEISPTLAVAVDGDLDTARNVVRASLQLYLGGMGSRERNFYVELAGRMGFEDEARTVQELYLDGKRDESFKAVPEDLIDLCSLVGTDDEVAERLKKFEEAGVDRIICQLAQFDRDQQRHTIERLAELAG